MFVDAEQRRPCRKSASWCSRRTPNKSRELWTQLIGLPAQFGLRAAGSRRATPKIAGHEATRYAYPGAPPIFVTQPSDDALVIGTAGAVESSLTAADAGERPARRSCWSLPTPATSKAIFLQFGPLVRLPRRTPTAGERASNMAAVAPLVDDTTASLTIDEDPNELRVRLEVTGVPRVAEVLQTVQRAIATRRELQAAGGW